MLQYVASIFAMNKTKELKTARILNQALEIIALITGEVSLFFFNFKDKSHLDSTVIRFKIFKDYVFVTCFRTFS